MAPIRYQREQHRLLDEQIAQALGATYVCGCGISQWKVASEDERVDLYVRLGLCPLGPDLHTDGLPLFSTSWAASTALRVELKRRGAHREFAVALLKYLVIPQQWLLAGASPEVQARAALEALGG